VRDAYDRWALLGASQTGKRSDKRNEVTHEASSTTFRAADQTQLSPALVPHFRIQ